MRLALAQINAVVGDLDGNRERILAALERGARRERRARALPRARRHRLPARGPAPPARLRARRGGVAARDRRARRGITALVGTPWFDRDLFNACAVCSGGELKALYRKRFLPNYGVFDEDRYFAPGATCSCSGTARSSWDRRSARTSGSPGPPATDLALAGAELLVNLSASPYFVGKAEDREEMLVTRARDNSAYLAFCNLVGGQDELLFDGHSVVLDDEGEVLARAPGFEEALLVVDLDPSEAIGRRLRDVRRRALAREREDEREPVVVELEARVSETQNPPLPGTIRPFEPELEQMRKALVLALRDYVGKNGFGDVVLGLSGGIDSALVATLAVDALGPERVHCVSMPSRYSSEGTQTDAQRLAENLGCDFRELPIEEMVAAFHEAGVGTTGLAAENLQARVRGMTLMSLSNEHGWLVLATGNKSELSVGYSTLYGDLAGGFALIKDVYKTDVFRLAGILNERAGRELIPVSIIERPPSAELRADQRDEDSLPPYDELDRVLEAYVELDRSREELLAEGHDPATVERALALIDRAEYKRRQAPPGVKLRPKAFGRDRRTPITNRWSG